MQHTYIPAVAQGEGAPYEGHLVLNLPNIDERLSYRKRITPDGLATLGRGYVGEDKDSSSKLKFAAEKYDVIASLVPDLPKHVAEVSLKRKEDGLEFKSIESLEYEPVLESVFLEVAMIMVMGVSASKK